MIPWPDQLRDQLQQRNDRHLRRHLHVHDRSGRRVRRNGRELLNFAGNDYLALADDPRLAESVAHAVRERGVGAGASRLITGTLESHVALERRLAAFKHAESALLLPTGYLANLAAITALAEPGDLICCDKLNHASLIDASRLSGATLRTYPHRDLDKLARLLDQTEHRGKPIRRKFIVTDAVFSMDGDCADLPALCALRDRSGAMLIVDEAHATGLLGKQGGGLAEMQDVAGRIDVTVSTASKALGSLGGIVSGSALVIDTLANAARPFIYTTAASPMQVAAIDAALDAIHDEPDRRVRLGELASQLRAGLGERGWAVADDPTPIVPLVIGEAERTVQLAAELEAAGLLVAAVRPPTVAPGSSRLRISLRCDHTEEDIQRLTEALPAFTTEGHRGPPR